MNSVESSPQPQPAAEEEITTMGEVEYEPQTEESEETMKQLVELLSPGDVFSVKAGVFKVDEWFDTSPVRPIAIVRKESVGGWMKTRYRLEPANPEDPDGTKLIIQADRKSGFDPWSTFDLDEIQLKDTDSSDPA